MRCAMTSEIQYPDRQQKLQKQPLILLYHRIRYQLHVHHTVAYTVLLGGRDRQYNLKLYNSFFHKMIIEHLFAVINKKLTFLWVNNENEYQQNFELPN